MKKPKTKANRGPSMSMGELDRGEHHKRFFTGRMTREEYARAKEMHEARKGNGRRR